MSTHVRLLTNQRRCRPTESCCCFCCCWQRAEVVSAVRHDCPAIEPPRGGYLHCSSRPNADGYAPGTTCRLRCRKGYVFHRQRPAPAWHNQVIDAAEDNTIGVGILQGWKATQVWPNAHWSRRRANNQSELLPKNIKGTLLYI